MDEESKRIIAKAARDHAKYEAQFAGLDYGSSSSETEDTESTEGSYHPDATVDTTYTTETTGLTTAASTRGGGGAAAAAAAEPAVVVSTFDDIANKKVLAQEAEVNSAPPLPRPAGDPSYTETASQVKEVTKVAAGYGVSRRGSGYNSGDEEDEEHRRRREQAEQQRRQAEAEAEALEAERLRNDPSYKETVSQVKEVTKVAAGYGASRRGGGYNSEDEEDEERRRREAAAAAVAAEAEAERRRTDPEYDALRRAEEEAERRRNDPSYKETVSQVKEVTKVAAGHGASRRGGGYNSEDEEDEERRRREAAAATAAAAAAAEAERRRTDPEYDAMRRAEEEAERRRNDPEYDAMRRAEEEAERRRRDAAYANETEEQRAERLAREASAAEAARVRAAESAMRRGQGGRRDGEYEDGVSQVKEVTKVATGVAAGRRGGGYNSEDDEDFSSEGGFEASEESYGGHHFFEGNSGTASGTTGKSSSASEYDDPNFRIHGGARRDEAYDGYGAGSDSISGRSSDRRDLPYGYDGENHSMASSSVAGSSEAYIATAMANETKTSEASRTASLTPIQRAAKRALERDSPYVPLSDLIPAYTENPERLKQALNTPIPYDHGVIQCTLRKRKRLLYFYLQPENRLLMIGYERNKVFSPGLNIMISVVPQPQKKRHEPSYIGKVRSNANFTKFNIYDGGISPKLVGVNKDDPTPPRRELAYVKYDLFPDAPRYMLVMTPRVRDDETWGDFVPHLPKHRDDDDGSMEARYKGGHHQDIEVSYNRKPEWNEKLGRFELDVKNRAQLPSTKNFMISTRLDPNHDSVLMGKAADKVYTISVQYPMTLFQGLTIAITAMYARTYR